MCGAWCSYESMWSEKGSGKFPEYFFRRVCTWLVVFLVVVVVLFFLFFCVSSFFVLSSLSLWSFNREVGEVVIIGQLKHAV